MGLILGVKAGEKIFVDNDWVKVVKVTGQQDFVIENEDGTGFTVRGAKDQPQEVLPEVFVSAGKIRSESPGRTARVFIEAPKDMKILREMPYRMMCLFEDSAKMIEGLLEMMAMPSPAYEAEAHELIVDLKDEIKHLTRGGHR